MKGKCYGSKLGVRIWVSVQVRVRDGVLELRLAIVLDYGWVSIVLYRASFSI